VIRRLRSWWPLDLPRLAVLAAVACLLAMTIHRSGADCAPGPVGAQVACASETGHGCDGDVGAVDPAAACELGCDWCHGALFLAAIAGDPAGPGARLVTGGLVPSPSGTACSADRLPPDPPPVRVG
jgi:hypothetical protein